MKQKYYLDLANGDIVQAHTGQEVPFTFYADEKDLYKLRTILDGMQQKEWESFFRAHIPFTTVDNAPVNISYDEYLKELYATLYELGDDAAKQHIESMGILDNPPNGLF